MSDKESSNDSPAEPTPEKTEQPKSAHWCRKLINLFNVLRYAGLLALVLFILPFSAFEWSGPLHTYVGGLMIGFKDYHLFWMAAVYCATAWALMLCTGLLVVGYKERIDANPTLTGIRQLPRWANDYLILPGPTCTFWAFTVLLAVPGIIIAIYFVPYSDQAANHSRVMATVCSLLGASFAFVVMVVASSLVRCTDEEFVVVAMPWAEKINRLIPRSITAPIANLVGVVFSYLPRKISFLDYMFTEVDGNPRKKMLKSAHLFSITNVLTVVVVYWCIAKLYYPFKEAGVPYGPPALAFFYMLLFLLIWAFSAIDFHFSRWQISPLLVATLWLLMIYTVFQSGFTREHTELAIDHHYEVIPRGTNTTMVEPIELAQKSDTLVIVTATGGGIWASGWFTASLQHLIQEHNLKYSDIRMVSTVSGGSVGAAQFIRARMAYDEHRGKPGYSTNWLASAFDNSVKNSLTAATYAFSSFDFWTSSMGGLAWWAHNHDRGLMIERRWAQIGAEPPDKKSGPWRLGDSTSPSVLELVPGIQSGDIPAPIFNCTVMETGRRIMTTPIKFQDRRETIEVSNATNSWLSPEAPRAQTLFELLTTQPTTAELNLPKPQALDVGMWPAARLSATFSYVSPAARARLLTERDMNAKKDTKQNLREFHLIDGGYYDNYGVASALDFLKPIVHERAKANSSLSFDKVLIIQLRSSFARPPQDGLPSSGFGAAVFGPLMGLANNRDASAVTRNQEALFAFIENWNETLKDKAEIVTVVFEYPKPDAPLSWHLTPDQKKDLHRPWWYLSNDKQLKNRAAWENVTSNMAANLKLMQDFLAK